MIKLIVAVEPGGVIGIDNGIPWKIKEDMQFFKETTTGHFLIMGRKTWESLGCKPLPKRYNIVVTRNKDDYNVADYNRTLFASSVDEAVSLCLMMGHGKGFIIGGTQIYEEALRKDLVDKAIVSHVKRLYEGDAKFPMNYLEDKSRELIREYDEFDVYEYTLRG